MHPKKLGLAVGLLAACTFACSKDKEAAPNEAAAVAAATLANNALAAKGQHIDQTKMLAALQGQTLQAQPKRDVVNFRKLTPFLPDAPAGWTATAPEGSTASAGLFQVSTVSRRYSKGKSTARLTITDMSQNPAAATVALAFSLTEDSTSGYRKPYNVGGVTGSEHWTVAGKRGEIAAMTKNQLFVQVDGSNLDGPEVARDLMAKIDVAKVAEVTP